MQGSRWYFLHKLSYSLFYLKFRCHSNRVGRGGICLTAFNSPTTKTPCCVQESRRYLPQKLSYWLFCFKFSLPWQQELVVVEFVWRHSIAQPPNPLLAQTSRWYFPYKLSYDPFCPKFRCHGNQGLSFKIYLTSFDSLTRKPPVRWKDLGDIYYTSRVIAVFVSNLVAMATGVGRGRICMTSFNSPTPKTPY